MSVERVKEPVLSVLADFHCIQAHPMVSDRQHEVDHQRLKAIVVLKIFYQFVELSFFLIVYEKVLILKLPGERVEFKLFMLPEDFKLLESLQTEFIVGSFKITI